jgi:hypothetical protein
MRQGVALTSVWSVTAQSSHTPLHQDFTAISPLLIPVPVASATPNRGRGRHVWDEDAVRSWIDAANQPRAEAERLTA